MGIENPEIIWQNNSPYSVTFQDIYFSSENGLDETKHVFIQGNDLIHRWKGIPLNLTCNSGKNGFTIFETGFGTGLNFCVAAKLFLENVSQETFLNYISVEKYPLSKSDLQRVLESIPEITDIAEKLISGYPLRMAGTHRLIFENSRIMLTIIFEDRVCALKQLYLTEPVDAWFLDGFSPARNEEMWSDDLFALMARFSGNGTTLSTFTCAGHVRRNLQGHGFKVTKVPGFAGKRQMITAMFSEPLQDVTVQLNENVSKDKTPDDPNNARIVRNIPEKNKHNRIDYKPWYYLRGKIPENKKVAIIGAGLSGCALADAFAKRNWHVDIIDQNKEICSEASGNPLGIFFPVVHRRPTYTSRFSTLSYLYIIRHLGILVGEGYAGMMRLEQNGLLQVIENAREIDRFAEFDAQAHSRTKICLDEFYEYLDSDTIKSKYGIISQGGVFFKNAGYISPGGLSEANLARHEKKGLITKLMSRKVDNFNYKNGSWIIRDQQNDIISTADVLVLANSWAMNAYPQTNWLGLQKIRGQLVKPEIRFSDLEIPVSAQTYMVPSRDGAIIGATHDLFDNPDIHYEQNRELIHKTYSWFPALEEQIKNLPANKAAENMYSRVSFRSAADDHFPVIGRLPDNENYKGIFSDLANGETSYYRKNGYTDRPEAWHENLFCLTGCGSRGILYSQLGAEIIASLANMPFGETVPLEKDLFEALSPARFLFRALKKKSL